MESVFGVDVTGWGPTIFNLSLTAIAAAAAVSSALSAHRAMRREDPVIEVQRLPDCPWSGWTTIVLLIRNHAPAGAVVEEISVPRFHRGLIEMADALATDAVATTRNYLTRRGQARPEKRLPAAAPEAALGRRKISGLDITVPASGDRHKLAQIICPDGQPVPRKLLIRYRWRDRRNRRMTVQAHT